MATIAVAGAGGFIGSHVVEQLLAAGHAVVAVDRPGADLSAASGAEIRLADLLNGDAAAAFAGCERVVNATGLFDLGASERALGAINVDLAQRVARAAKAAGARRVVHVSSVAVYGTPAAHPMREGDALRPGSAYERTKRDGERAALAEGNGVFEVAVIRPTLVYGPRSSYGHAMMIAAAAQAHALGARRLPLLGGGPLGHHVHVRDVARAIVMLCFHADAAGRCFNVADDHPLPFGDSLITIARAVGLEGVGVALARPMWRGVGLLANRLGTRALERLNAQLARGHRALGRRGIHARLEPRFDDGWLQYLAGDYVFDTRRLRSLGFRFEHGDFRASVRPVIDWYRSAGWVALRPSDPRSSSENRA